MNLSNVDPSCIFLHQRSASAELDWSHCVERGSVSELRSLSATPIDVPAGFSSSLLPPSFPAGCCSNSFLEWPDARLTGIGLFHVSSHA